VAGVFPPLIEVAIEGKTSTDHDRLLIALDMLMTVDPRVGAQIDLETRQIVLKAGPAESDVEDVIERLRRDMNIGLNVGAPQVAYREGFAADRRATTPTKGNPVAGASSPASRCVRTG